MQRPNEPISQFLKGSIIRKLIIATWFVWLPFVPSSQVNTDSLWGVWSNEDYSDEARLNAIGDMALKGFLRNNPDSAMMLAQMQGALSLKIGDMQHLAQAMNIQGRVHTFQGDYKSALKVYTEALKINERVKDKRGAALTYRNLGTLYMEQMDSAHCVEYFTQSLNLSKEVGDRTEEAYANSSLGNVFYAMGYLDEAIQYQEQALEITSESNNEFQIGVVACNLAIIYKKLGDMDLAADRPKRAAAQFEKSMSLQMQSAGVWEKRGETHSLGNSYYNIGNLHFSKKEYTQAISYGLKSLQCGEEVNAAISMREASDLLYKAYKASGQDKLALAMHERYISTRDSIFSVSNQQAIFKQAYKFEYEKEALTDSLEFAKKEAVMVEKTEKQRIGLAATGMGLGLLLLLAFSIHRGKRKSDELLLNILPEETAQELKQKGSADAKLIDEVTVLFTDFKGFTRMSEQLSPKELVHDLHECFSAFDGICGKYGIEKIKTIGDAYMAAGGLPVPNDTHPQHVIRAALEMAEVVENGKQMKIAAGLPFFEIRIGVHTGAVVAGIVGVKKFQYDIWGDTVNTASRMESSGEVGKVNISETTYNKLKQDSSFTFTARGEIVAKGKGKLQMYFAELSKAIEP